VIEQIFCKRTKEKMKRKENDEKKVEQTKIEV